ncbi:MAG: hypothetical protein RIT43_2364 [Bacteroidota bacterium]|jgi:uncharacterized protein (TIGR01777 family)
MSRSKDKVLIAGGTGLIGRKLAELLTSEEYEVVILSRKPKNPFEFYWDPIKMELDEQALDGVTVIINLSGAGIADKRWTDTRKKELEDSRVGSNNFLFSKRDKMPHLRQFICASGINAYAPGKSELYSENDAYGEEFLPQLVKKWEESAKKFHPHARVALVRTAVVLANEGGAFPRLSKLTKLGLGSGLGRGDQPMPWIHMDDLAEIYLHIIKTQLEGTFNAVASNDSNAQFMRSLAKEMKKPFILPNVPGWLLKIGLGEMSSVLLDGVSASNEKILKTGFQFKYPSLESSLKQLVASSK